MTDDGQASESSALEQLVRDLVGRRSESKGLDYKRAMSFSGKRSRGEIVKCLMALANTEEGGFILVGVDGDSGSLDGLDPEQVATFDPTLIGAFARRHCSELPDFTSAAVVLDGQTLILLTVRPFRHEPIVCSAGLHDENGKLVLRAGAVYVRTDDAKCEAVETAQEMRELVRLAVTRHEGDLLAQIRDLVGPPVSAPLAATPEPYSEQLRDAQIFFEAQDIIGPHWQFVVRPVEWNPRRLKNRDLRRIRAQAAVSLRGWDFPHVDREHDHAFDDGVESVTRWFRYHEAHRAYRSGAFIWRRLISEDVAKETEDGRPQLRFLSAIFNLTEFGLFAARWIHDMEISGDSHIGASIEGLQGRLLTADPNIAFVSRTTEATRFEAASELSALQLENGWRALMAEWGTELFELFDADVSPGIVNSWQERLLTRGL